jgi:signal recognition particle receptor subunit alpha
LTLQKTKSDDDVNNEEILKNRQKLAQKFEKKSSKIQEKPAPAVEEIPKKPKEKTQWMMPKDSITSRDMKKFDNSKIIDKNDAVEAEDKMLKEKYLGGEEEKLDGFIGSDESEESEEETEIKKASKKKGFFSKLTDGFQSITGNKTITNEDIESILVKFKEDLLHKNVGEEISQRLCDSIKTSLIDKKTQAFTSLRKTVKNCLEEALTKILTPKKNINILSDAMKAKKKANLMLWFSLE